MASIGFSFVPFKSKHQFQLHKLKKAKMLCLGFEPRTARWYVQTYPLSYDSTLFDILAAIFKRKGYTKYNVM